MMFKTADLGRNLLIALILSVFVLPVANAGLVEIYINDSEELTESKLDGKTRYEYENTHGEYYLIEANGNLALYDESGKVTECVKINQ